MNENNSSQWMSLIKRIRQEARSTLYSNRKGVAIITIHLAIGFNGEPIGWLIPQGKKVEPAEEGLRNMAEAFLAALAPTLD